MLTRYLVPLLSLASAPSAVAAKKTRFQVSEDILADRKSTKFLPPKFVAEKYGKKSGDAMNVETARKIDAEAEELGERPLNFFSVGNDEVLLLPEVMSVLDPEDIRRDFAAPPKEPQAAPSQEELALRDSRWWGRLYIDGWPQTIQYLRAHFGAPPPLGPKRFVLAEPSDLCGPLVEPEGYPGAHGSANGSANGGGGGGYYADAVVVARRGTCTFSSKAKRALASATPPIAALVLVNNEAGNEHLTGPDAHDIPLSVSMLAQADGDLLLSVLERDHGRYFRNRTTATATITAKTAGAGMSGGAAELTGAMVPIHCAARTAVAAVAEGLGDSLCGPATDAERRAAKGVLEGGWLTIEPLTASSSNGVDSGSGAPKAPSSSSSSPSSASASASASDSSSLSGSSSSSSSSPPHFFEFLIATFGTKVDTARPMEVVALPNHSPDACEPIVGATSDDTNSDSNGKDDEGKTDPPSAEDADASAAAAAAPLPLPLAGKAVLVPRGGCNFFSKARNAVDGGAAAVLVVNSETHLQRFGVEPRWRGLEIPVPVVMVTDVAGAALAATLANADKGQDEGEKKAGKESAAEAQRSGSSSESSSGSGVYIRFTLSDEVRERVWAEDVAPWGAKSGADDSGKHWSARGLDAKQIKQRNAKLAKMKQQQQQQQEEEEEKEHGSDEGGGVVVDDDEEEHKGWADLPSSSSSSSSSSSPPPPPSQLLLEVLTSAPIAGFPEREAAVRQGYSALYPATEGVAVDVTPEAVAKKAA